MTARHFRQEAFNLPNAITMIRVAMIPVFLWFTYYESRVDSFVAALIYAATGATDFLDGWVARRTGTVTVIGKFLDPLADKLILMSVLIMLVHLGRVPAWLVILILAREFTVTGLRTMAMSEGIVIAAGQEGKHKATFQVAGITFLLLHYTYPVDIGVWAFEFDANKVGTLLLFLSLAYSIWSMVDYFVGFIRAVYKPAEGPQ